MNNHDGTYTKRIFTKPVHIKKGNVWEEISTELIEQNGSEYKPKNTELAVSFKKEMLNGNYAQFNHEEHTFLVRLVQASGEQGTRKVNSVISTVEGNKIWYKQVFL